MSLVDQLKADLRSVHVRQQAGRFVRLAVVSFGAQLAAVGTVHLGWQALASAGVGAVEVAYRQWMPALPLKAVAKVLPDPKPAAVAAVPPVVSPGSGPGVSA